jgi:hypothetical protein
MGFNFSLAATFQHGVFPFQTGLPQQALYAIYKTANASSRGQGQAE